jgi:protein involved in polysaccharide export with SLBB domain
MIYIKEAKGFWLISKRELFMTNKKLGIIFGMICLFSITTIKPVWAQSTTPTSSQSIPSDLSNVNVADLSDGQIRQLLAKGQAAGLSDDDLIMQAQDRGLPDDQVDLLKQRIADVRSKGGLGITNADSTGQTTNSHRRLNYVPDSTDNQQTNIVKSRIFGADLFRNKKIKFEPNIKIATPVNYIVGPEDQLVINVYGKSVTNWKLEVTPDGNINVPSVGIINVAGKTIEQSAQLIKSRLSASHYAIGQGTSVQVSLGNIRSIKVIMVGQLMRPGTYTLPSLATVFNALYAAGGPTDNGSFRQIAVIRNNRVIRTLDVYDFLTKGDQKDNIGLQDQDIIQVPTYRTRVEMLGEVKIPGIFESIPGETLQDMLNFAGGFTTHAYTARIKVIQVADQQKKITDVVEDDYKSYTPLRGDKYIIERVLDRYENRVTITGAVFRPGEYELQKGLTISKLIANASGLKEDAFGRGNITRLNPDNSKALIPFSVKDILNKTAMDIPLQREDSVSITSIFDLRDNYTVMIKGEVRKAGTYAYADSMTVEDLVIKAGGFAQGASSQRIEVARRINNGDPTSENSRVAEVFSVNADDALKSGSGNFVLKPYDIVSVYSQPGYETQRTIKVEGEVIYPGYYTILKKDEKISDIVKRAGGVSASADIDGGTLKRNNIAILGVEKNKADTAELARERKERQNRLKQSYDDASKGEDTTVMRNNYVGIDLKAIIEKPGSSIDLLVEDGDVIRIPKKQQIVRVNGEVLYPSAVVYTGGKSFKGYVLNAGGFSPHALRSGAYIVYANGTVKGTRKSFIFFNSHPSVKPGSEIYVPRKPPPPPNSIQEIVGLSTGLVSLLAIIIGIVRL